VASKRIPLALWLPNSAPFFCCHQHDFHFVNLTSVDQESQLQSAYSNNVFKRCPLIHFANDNLGSLPFRKGTVRRDFFLSGCLLQSTPFYPDSSQNIFKLGFKFPEIL
jgi:hypothetical protein